MHSHFGRITGFILALSLLSGCSYRWGFRERSVPGGYKEIAIPIFKNRTQEVGVESDFTNALVLQFERSQVARVTSQAAAPVRVEGEIIKITLTGTGSGLIGSTAQNSNTLPLNAALWPEYEMDVEAKLTVRRQSDEKILWQGKVSDKKIYEVPRIGEPVVNSANATYNESARRHALAALADEMMSEAHDRITENF